MESVSVDFRVENVQRMVHPDARTAYTGSPLSRIRLHLDVAKHKHHLHVDAVDVVEAGTYSCELVQVGTHSYILMQFSLSIFVSILMDID